MKKLFLSTAFAMSVLAASAQTGGTNVTTRISKSDRDYLVFRLVLTDDIRQLSNQMQLNEGQYIRLRDLIPG